MDWMILVAAVVVWAIWKYTTWGYGSPGSGVRMWYEDHD